jgi:threonine/homoserine/homoserine lactone efflux protein
MPVPFPLLIKGVALGLGAAVPIGPVNVQIARRALRGGFASGFALGCGAVTVDVVYAVLSSLGLRRVVEVPAVEWALRVAGTALLAYLGTMCLRGEREAWRADAVLAPGASTRPVERRHAADYVTGLLMTLLNPMTIAFWFVAVPALVGSITDDPAKDLPAVCAGVFLGTIGWVVFFSAGLSLAGRFRRNWWLAAADAVGGASLLLFAGTALVASVRAAWVD